MKINKLLKRSFFVLLAVLIVSPLIFVNQGQTKIQPYYSGDAVNYRGDLIVATANTGYLEIFKLTDKNLDRVLKVKIFNPTFNNYEDYSDVKLVVENNNLYVYAVAQYTLFKYDFSGLSRLVLISKEKNTSWNWYYRFDRYGDNFGIVSKNGVEILNSDLQNINSFAFQPQDKYSLRSNGSNDYFFAVNNGKIQIYDKTNRLVLREIPLNFTEENANHKIYFDSWTQNIYAVDDYYAKKFSFDGRLLASFRHLDASGYDIESYSGSSDIYFSNGLGVVKLDKDTFKVKNSIYTSNIGGPQGWAMGLKVVNFDDGDKIVVFNSSNILVLNKNLKKAASILAEEESAPEAKEALFLNYNHNFGSKGATIKLVGGGYWPQESVQISFGPKVTATIPVDNRGRFDTDLIVPDLEAQRLDIKVKGVDSGLSYSISFEIK